MDQLAKFEDYLLVIANDQLRSVGSIQLDPMDLVQEAFVRAQLRWDQYQGTTDGELAAWLRSILTNYLIDLLRRSGRETDQQKLTQLLDESSVRLERWLVDQELTPRRRSQYNEQLLMLSSALMRLPEQQRTAVELRYLRSLPIEQICQQMQRSPASVGGLLQRGLAGLRRMLERS